MSNDTQISELDVLSELNGEVRLPMKEFKDLVSTSSKERDAAERYEIAITIARDLVQFVIKNYTGEDSPRRFIEKFNESNASSFNLKLSAEGKLTVDIVE